jgi:DNA polymerase-3 subunit gamma/tau
MPAQDIAQEKKQSEEFDAPVSTDEASSDGDSVSQLQDLFAMEDDLASYEQQLQETSNDPAQSERASIDLGDGPKLNADVSDGDITGKKLEALNEQGPESLELETVESSNSPPWDESTKEHLPEKVEAENSEKELVLSARLESGEKLVSASQIDKWSRFVNSLNVRGLARQLLIHGRSSGIKDKRMVIEISKEHHHLNEQSSVSSIRQALKDQYQQDIDLVVEYAEVENTPYEIQLAIDAMRLAHAKTVIHNDSAIQELKKAFDAEVLDESIEFR